MRNIWVYVIPLWIIAIVAGAATSLFPDIVPFGGGAPESGDGVEGLYFSADSRFDDGRIHRQLLRVNTDGVVERVFEYEIPPGLGSPSEFNGELYFPTTDGVRKVNTNGGQVQLLTGSKFDTSVLDSPNYTLPRPFTEFNGELYLPGRFDGLWKVQSDGSVVQVSDMTNVSFLTELNDELYLGGARNIWKVQSGGSVVQVSSVGVPRGPDRLPEFKGELYFQGENGEPWKIKSDGSAVQVFDINPGQDESNTNCPYGFTEFNDALYFAADDGAHGCELWKVTAGGGVLQVADIHPGEYGSRPEFFTEFGGELYFRADYDSELWKVRSDGNVVRVFDIWPGLEGSYPAGFTAFNGALYFAADNGADGRELWKVTAGGGLSQVADINPGDGDAFTSVFYTGLAEFSGALYFAAYNGANKELWRVTAGGDVEKVDSEAYDRLGMVKGVIPFME